MKISKHVGWGIKKNDGSLVKFIGHNAAAARKFAEAHFKAKWRLLYQGRGMRLARVEISEFVPTGGSDEK